MLFVALSYCVIDVRGTSTPARLEILIRMTPISVATRRMDRIGRRLAVKQDGQLAHGPLVEQRMRHVIPGDLREVRLGQVDPERVVIGWLPAQERVAVVVDDRNRRKIDGHWAAPVST